MNTKSNLEKVRAWAKKYRKGINFTFFVVSRGIAGIIAFNMYLATLPILTQINAATGVGAEIGAVIMVLIVASWFFKYAISPPEMEGDFVWDKIDDFEERISKLEQ